MSSTLAIAPTPTSPHASVLATGGTTRAPSSSASTARCFAVNGLSHISVFIAGARRHGLARKSHARRMHVRRLSQRPFAALARVFAERGATTRRSAQRRSSMWRTGSPTARHCRHSDSSPRRGSTSESPPASPLPPGRKCLAACVATTLTSANSLSASSSDVALTAATLPLTPSSTRGLRPSPLPTSSSAITRTANPITTAPHTRSLPLSVSLPHQLLSLSHSWARSRSLACSRSARSLFALYLSSFSALKHLSSAIFWSLQEPTNFASADEPWQETSASICSLQVGWFSTVSGGCICTHARGD
mmetsp:Transcript_29312/g.95533  ORF Transcript_29312/g.95533 Transcript_29312/m.95533 type:complete len:304 (-) Transcript_29312:3-914(-)